MKTKRHWRPRSFAWILHRVKLSPSPDACIFPARVSISLTEKPAAFATSGSICRTGLSGAHYAIIEQGRIGQILSAKPSDRRNLIEEAAGISKFRPASVLPKRGLIPPNESRSYLGYRFRDRKTGQLASPPGGKDAPLYGPSGRISVLLRQLFAAEGKYCRPSRVKEISLRPAAEVETDLHAGYGQGRSGPGCDPACALCRREPGRITTDPRQQRA